MGAKAKPKRWRGRAEDLEVLGTKPRRGAATYTVLLGGPEPNSTNNGDPAKKTTKKAKTANELMLGAWKYSWENRHRRLTNRGPIRS